MRTHTSDDERINITVAIVTDGARYLAAAPHLRTVGYGNSKEEAIADFEDAVRCFFRIHRKQGTLDLVLQRLGWALSSSRPQEPGEFNVPTHLLRNAEIQGVARRSYSMAQC